MPKSKDVNTKSIKPNRREAHVSLVRKQDAVGAGGKKNSGTGIGGAVGGKKGEIVQVGFIQQFNMGQKKLQKMVRKQSKNRRISHSAN
jgi:hypothetical protein